MVKLKQEIGSQLRILLILRAIMDSRLGVTILELKERFNVSKDTIRRDLYTLTTAGFIVEMDNKYRYRFKKEKEYKQLKNLLHFSEEEQILLHDAIDTISPYSKRAKTLKKKLASLYDFRKLGHSYLKRPYLQKLDMIQKAIDDKKQVVLENYRSSNSNKITNRLVEPFHINITEDILFAFEPTTRIVKNYKLSRINRVVLQETNWQFEGHHNIIHTDPFRISGKEMVMVHLRITLAGKNELIERFPLTKAHIIESEINGTYEFQCEVNKRFLGLDNFILGFHREIIEIISPDELITHLKNDIEKIKKIEGFF